MAFSRSTNHTENNQYPNSNEFIDDWVSNYWNLFGVCLPAAGREFDDWCFKLLVL